LTLLAAQAVTFGGQSTEAAAIFKLGGATSVSGAAMAADLGHDLQLLGNLFEAVTERRRALFTYKDLPRTVEPYGLGHRFGHWYLLAREVGAATTVKAFRLDRMEQLKIDESEAMFERPSDFEAAKVLPEFGRSTGDDDITARIQFDKDIAQIALAQASNATEVASDAASVTADLSVTSIGSFIGWMLGFDDKAVILGPPELVDAYVSFLEGDR
jgi:predicted DNA-binding transcriptional regulator YafY